MSNAIITFLTKYDSRKGEYSYKVEGHDNLEYKGKQSNDAPIKYLIDYSGKKIDKILCIASKSVREDEDSIPNLKDIVKEFGCEKCVIDPIPFDENEEDTAKRMADVYERIAQHGKDIENYYLDCTGGFRDTNFLMIYIARYLEYSGKKCKRIVYSDFQRTPEYTKTCLRPIDDLYSIIAMFNGVEQFVNTGNANGLDKFFQKESIRNNIDLQELSVLNKLIESLQDFSKTMSICLMEDLDSKIKHVTESIREFEQVKSDNLYVKMLKDLVPVIKKKMDLEDESKYINYLGLVKWCVENGLIQQALTIFREKIPKYLYKRGYLRLDNEAEAFMGKSKELEAFLNIYDEFDYMRNYKGMNEFLEIIKRCTSSAMVERGELDKLKKNPSEKGKKDFQVGYIKQLKKILNKEIEINKDNEEVYRALCRLRSFIGISKDEYKGIRAIYGDDGFIKVEYKIYDELIKKEKRTSHFILDLSNYKSNNYRYAHYFLVNDEEDYKNYYSAVCEKEKNDSNDKRKHAYALKNMKEQNKNSKYSNIESQDLYELLLYHQAISLFRNKINHASEEDSKDVERTIEILENDLNLGSMELSFDNVKRVVMEAVNAIKDIDKKSLLAVN